MLATFGAWEADLRQMLQKDGEVHEQGPLAMTAVTIRLSKAQPLQVMVLAVL